MSRDSAQTLADSSFEALEREQLRRWMQLDTASRIDFFEEMVAIAYQGGALTPERLALRDQPCGTEASVPHRARPDAAGQG